jgi:hypothetical protein
LNGSVKKVDKLPDVWQGIILFFLSRTTQMRMPFWIMRDRGQRITKFTDTSFVTCIKRILPLMLLLCYTLLFSLTSPTLAEPDKIIIYFYSSETNINNFKSLKMEFDSYLAEFDGYEFQPFSDRKTFEEHVKDKKQSLLLLSSWHYTLIREEYSLKPILVGVKNDQKYQKRILVTSDSSADIESVKTGQIASASSVQHTISTLREIFTGGEAAAESFKILTVPKDIDALMSVGFGMAKSALTTESSLDNLKMLNPPLYKKMRILGESEESLLLVVAVPETFAESAEGVVNILQEMSTNPDGEKRIRMLGLDGWQLLDSSDESKLEG